jgi:hypothetical protein
VKISFRSPSGDWYLRSRSAAATSPSSTFSLPGRRRGGEPSLEDVFCEVNDLVTLRGAVAAMRVHRA